MSAFRFILCIGIIVATLNDARAVTAEEAKKMFNYIHEISGDCKKEFGVTKETFKDAKMKGSLDSIDPCFFACLYRNMEIMNDEGKYNEKIAIEKTTAFFSSDEEKSKVEEVLKDCASVNNEKVSDGDKGCDRAKLMAVCFEKIKEVIDMPSTP